MSRQSSGRQNLLRQPSQAAVINNAEQEKKINALTLQLNNLQTELSKQGQEIEEKLATLKSETSADIEKQIEDLDDKVYTQREAQEQHLLEKVAEAQETVEAFCTGQFYRLEKITNNNIKIVHEKVLKSNSDLRVEMKKLH